MRSRFAARAFSALIYCQALLIFAGVASVILRDRSDANGSETQRSMALQVLPAGETRL